MVSVTHISSVHQAFDVRILEKQCKSLARAGYHVTLIIQHPTNIQIDNVNVVGLPVAKTKRERFTKVIPSLLKKVLQIKKNTLIHFHDPELIPLGILLKIKGHIVIYDVHEDLPKDILYKNWIPKAFRIFFSKAMKFIEYLSAYFFDSVITVTEPISERFQHTNVTIIRNFPQLYHFSMNKVSSIGEYVIYVGDITDIRGAREMIKAVELVDDDRVGLKLAGRIVPNQLLEEVVIPSKRAEYLGWLGRESIAKYLEEALGGLVVLHPTSGYLEAYPVKLFEYMAAGIPVIASDFPLWRDIIEKNNCGILVDPLNPKDIADAITYLYKNPQKAKEMGENGRRAVIEKYNWEQEEVKLLNIYSELIKEN